MDEHGQTQNVEAFKRKLYERIGAWIVEHWTQLSSGIGGFLGGAFTLYLLFAAQVHNSLEASADAKQVAMALQATVNQLVTQQQLAQALERIARLEQFEGDARGYKPESDINRFLPRPRGRAVAPTPGRGNADGK